MANKYSSLEELRKQKEILKSEVQELEGRISFNNAKESLSAFTNGYSDKFLKEETDEEGHVAVSLKTNVVVKEVANEIKDRMIGKNPILSLADNVSKNGIAEEAAKLAIVAIIGNYTKKNLKNANWKKRAIGLALVYIAPIAIRFAIKKLEEYQRHSSVSSLEKLI